LYLQAAIKLEALDEGRAENGPDEAEKKRGGSWELITKKGQGVEG